MLDARAADAAASRTLLGGLVMFWMFLFGLIGTGLIGPNRSAIEREFGLSHGQFGAAFAVVQIVCSVAVLGAVAGRRRFRSVAALRASLLIQAVGFITVFLSRSAPALALGWAMITLGSVLGAVANNLSARLWPDNPRRGVTLLHGFNGLGKVAGPLIAVVCLALGWRVSFLVVGGITLLLLGLFHRLRPRFAAYDDDDDAGAADAEAAPPSPGLPAAMGILRAPRYYLCILPFGLIAGGDVAFAALVPLFYETRHGVSPTAASLLLTAHLVGLAAGRFAFVYLSERMTNNAVIGGCLACGLFALPAALSPEPSVWAASLFGAGILFSSTWPTFYAQVARFFAPGTSHLLDYGSGLGNALGIAVCVWASSALADHNLVAALLFGPAALGVFGLVYFGTWLSQGDDAAKEGLAARPLQ